jgi:hypothetical protein
VTFTNDEGKPDGVAFRDGARMGTRGRSGPIYQAVRNAKKEIDNQAIDFSAAASLQSTPAFVENAGATRTRVTAASSRSRSPPR